MTTLALAKAKWARKMAVAGARWKAGVTGKAGAYASGIGAFLGITVPVGHAKVTAWTSGVGAVSAAEFQSAVAGKEDKWADKLRAAFS